MLEASPGTVASGPHAPEARRADGMLPQGDGGGLTWRSARRPAGRHPGRPLAEVRNRSADTSARTVLQAGTTGDVYVGAEPGRVRGAAHGVEAALATAVPVSLADPRALGVHPAPAAADGSRLAPYVDRDRDGDIRRAVGAADSGGGMVLVTGDSAAGKTRALLHALAAVAPRRLLVAPPRGTPLNVLAERIAASPGHCGPGVVVWLDGIDGFLDGDAARLTGTALDLFTRERAVLAATLRTEHLDAYRTTGLLRRLDPVTLERPWSPGEVERAAAHGDPRLASAARCARRGVHGVAEYLAAGPFLHGLWRDADRCSANHGRPRGHALVAAAVDLVRAGAPAPFSTALLKRAHTVRLRGREALRPEGFAEALAWARRVRLGASGLLVPGDLDGRLWRPHDYLVDTAEGAVPDEVRRTAQAQVPGGGRTPGRGSLRAPSHPPRLRWLWPA
ncbi:hypothetical protein [Nocardiopsis halophila]|uniref:hypothetical protein n=1 Tax=Nocardiopsis halophila TaxID=141692 RepID=UPI0012692635|nr:hypothetical protein [Nocardiopsis halophila]